jgi:hypothetical protein
MARGNSIKRSFIIPAFYIIVLWGVKSRSIKWTEISVHVGEVKKMPTIHVSHEN